jgi:threonine/homoserine/homoserine lactone efflux protein
VPDAAHLAVFCAAALALLLVPGPAVLYVVTQSIDQGRRAGLASVAGIHTGTLVHVAAATAGLSAVLASSALAFDIVKYAGAAYLLVVGIRRLAGRDRAATAQRPVRALYRQGIVVNVLNPKTALFFVAFLPQFATTWRGVLVLGLIFGLLGFVTDGAYALLAGTFGERLRARQRLQRYVSGVVFVALGAFAALTSPPRRA